MPGKCHSESREGLNFKRQYYGTSLCRVANAEMDCPSAVLSAGETSQRHITHFVLETGALGV